MLHARARSAALATVAALACGGAAAAEESWQHTATVYMIGASIDGKASIGNLDADVNVGFDDILDNLEFGAMASYRGKRGRWAVVADLIYMDLEQKKDGLGPAGRTRAKVEGDQLITELDLSYALTDRLDVYGGLRYWDLDADLHIYGGGPLGKTLAASESESWLDPVVGLRYEWPLGRDWTLVARGDIGGFGIGSDFSWHATAFASWAMSEHANLLIGYRHLDVDYDDGSGAGRFRWDVAEGGPALGFAWRF